MHLKCTCVHFSRNFKGMLILTTGKHWDILNTYSPQSVTTNGKYLCHLTMVPSASPEFQLSTGMKWQCVWYLCEYYHMFTLYAEPPRSGTTQNEHMSCWYTNFMLIKRYKLNEWLGLSLVIVILVTALKKSYHVISGLMGCTKCKTKCMGT
jgi:hypothetical protein